MGDKVSRAIGAVGRLAEQNHKVVFDDCGEGSYIQNNETGVIHKMSKKDNGDYVVYLDVAPYKPF